MAVTLLPLSSSGRKKWPSPPRSWHSRSSNTHDSWKWLCNPSLWTLGHVQTQTNNADSGNVKSAPNCGFDKGCDFTFLPKWFICFPYLKKNKTFIFSGFLYILFLPGLYFLFRICRTKMTTVFQFFWRPQCFYNPSVHLQKRSFRLNAWHVFFFQIKLFELKVLFSDHRKLFTSIHNWDLVWFSL